MRATFEKQLHKIRCDIFGCNEMAKYQVGSKGKPILNLNLCERCAKEILSQIPEELKPKKPKVTVKKTTKKGGK